MDPEPQTPSPAPHFSNVDAFVREYLVHVYRRKVGERATRRWSARWWESPEALTRLEALWRAWEQLRLDPNMGMSVWFRDHADYHMGVLMDPDGPFRSSTDQANETEPLPYTPPPPGLVG